MSIPNRPAPVSFKLADVTTTEQLAVVLGVPLKTFRRVVRCAQPLELYFRHEIEKKNPRRKGDVRVVWETRDEQVARAHKAIARRLDIFARQQSIGYPHKAIHGFVRGGSTRSNAEPHCGARLLLRADIEEFFPRITEQRVVKALRSVGMKTRPAKALARFATIDGHLPLGLPESPVLSNLICLQLDQDIQSTADKRKLRYTRYADDITLSGYADLPSREEMRAILARHDFSLADRKFRVSKRGQSHYVTGLSVSERDVPHAPKQIKRRLRQEIYFCEKFGLASHAAWIDELERKTFNRLDGTVQYVAFIERRIAATLRNRWEALARSEGRETTFASLANRPPRNVYAVVDEIQFEQNGLGYLAICVARTNRPKNVDLLLNKLRSDYQTQPGAKGDLEKLRKVGIHYNEAHPDLRTRSLDLLTELPWSASIYFAQLPNHRRYKDTYLRLLGGALQQEFMTADGCTLAIDVERNDKVKAPSLRNLVDTTFNDAERRGDRRPIAKPSVSVVRKEDTACVTVPDFALATFRNFVQPKQPEHHLEFERIRDNIRYIYDADRDYFYTRKRPLIEIGLR
jgi:hypothetical protein